MFCLRQKTRRLLVFTINLQFPISSQISNYRKLNLPLTSSIYLVFLPLEMQKRLKQTKVGYTTVYTKRFLALSEKKQSTNICKCQLQKLFFSSVFFIGGKTREGGRGGGLHAGPPITRIPLVNLQNSRYQTNKMENTVTGQTVDLM